MKHCVVALLLMLAACGDDPSFQPEACAQLTDVSLFKGELDAISLCFTDPDGDELTVTATSSNPEAVDVAIQGGGRALSIRAQEVGSSQIVVTAKDPSNKMIDLFFTVTVPNRAPELTAALPEVALTNETPSATMSLSQYFHDPDDHVLTYTAESSNQNVVQVDVTEDVLELQLAGSGIGTADVRLTAADSYDGEATGSMTATIHVTTDILDDEFETPVDDRWIVRDFTAIEHVEEEDRVSIRPTDVEYIGVMERDVAASTNWTLTVDAEYTRDHTWPAIFFIESLTAPRYIIVLIGGNLRDLLQDPSQAETNLVVLLRDGDNLLTTVREWSALDERIPSAGEATEFTFSMESDGFKIKVADQLIHSVPIKTTTTNGVSQRLISVGLGTWPDQRQSSLDESAVSLFDYIRVKGILVESTEPAPALQMRSFELPKTIKVLKK